MNLWIYVVIIVGGCLQADRSSMNGQRRCVARHGHRTIRFAADPSSRFTPTPAVNPIVEATKFC
jgi:hypothetical protein